MAHGKQVENISSGIDELVERLKNDGIEAGQQRALDIISEAEARADQLIRQAEEKARQLLQHSHEQTERQQQAAKDALQLAFRDMVLDMKTSLLERLSNDFSQRVAQYSANDAVVQQLVIEAVQTITSGLRLPGNGSQGNIQQLTVQLPKPVAEQYPILKPDALLALDDIRANPEAASEGLLADLVFSLSEQMLSEGIHFSAGEQQGGIRMQLNNGEMHIDMSDKAIADLLLQYLQPRFRAILEGVIH